LVFSGEHFADESEIQGLRADGHQCPCKNASYLVHFYEREGPRFFEKLNGVFCGLLLDLRERKAIVFNDRFGLSRVYWHETGDAFYFASEAKALLAVLPSLRQLDARGLGEFLSCGCPLQGRTIFSGVQLLPPATMWTSYPAQPLRKDVYFDRKTWENQPPLSPADYYSTLKETFSAIMPRYLNGKLPIGLSLTGGLDSRMILAEMNSSTPCYTFSGMYRESSDVRIAREAARICRHPYQTVPISSDFFGQFPALAAHCVECSDGTMDVTGAVELYANRLARTIAPVRLTGNYGSEILRGNVAFRPSPSLDSVFTGDVASTFCEAAATYAAERQGPLVSFIAFKQTPWHHFARFSVEQSQLVVRSPFLDKDIVPLAYHAPDDLPENKRISLRMIAERKAELGGLATDRGSSQSPWLVPPKMWAWCQEFMPRAEYVYDYGMPQWLAKVDHVLSPLHFDRLFLGRQKFYHFRSWYKNELADYVQQVLLDSRTLGRPYLNWQRVEQIVTEHVGGHGNHTNVIHKLLTLELIQRQLVERQ
jgi:asparagine synthase (glutamine-hydrolysing)